MFVGGEGRERGTDGYFGFGRCRLLHLEQMGDGALLYSTGNCDWSLGLEKKKKKEWECMGGWVTLLYSRNRRNIVNQLYFNKKI